MAEIKDAKLSDLTADDKNFNRGTEYGGKLLRDSLGRFGAGRSILVDKNGKIIAGNKTAEACADLGLDDIQVVETDGRKLVVVKRTDVDLDTPEGREMALADNAVGAVDLDWDLDVLGQTLDLDTIKVWGVELDNESLPLENNETRDDDFDQDKDYIEVRCERGDVWQLGEHRLMCGDSIQLADIKKLMGGGLADLVITDPPYNVAVENSKGLKIANDNMESKKFGDFLTSAFSAMHEAMKPGAPFYVWYASREHINFEQSLLNAGLRTRQQIVWNKNAFIIGHSDYQWKHELCLYGWKDGAPHYFRAVRNEPTVIPDVEELNIEKMRKDDMAKLLHELLDDKTPSTIMNENKPFKDDDHPTMKPVRLFGRLMVNSSHKGDVVLDSFGGSGTTIVCAEQLGRKARIMELDPHYCDVIIARWEKLTGKKATKL